MTGEDFIEISSRLLLSSIGNPEARHRSAVNRAYYGAFHLAVSFLNTVGVALPRNSECHEQAYRALVHSGDSDGIEAARLLNDLRTARNEADYRLDKTRLLTQANARTDIEMAVAFQQKLKLCSEEPKKSQIMAKVRS